MVDELNELAPDIVIVTGDLTDMGFRAEFRQAHRLLQRIECARQVVLIGNHDARNVGDVHFEELFGARRIELELAGVARRWGSTRASPTSTPGASGATCTAGSRNGSRSTRRSSRSSPCITTWCRCLAPGASGTSCTTRVTCSACSPTTAWTSSLCGHKHVPNVWRLEDMLIVNAGTCCTHRLRGKVRPSYNIIEIRDNTNVRILRKEPYVDAEIVGDYRGLHQHVCGWRPGASVSDPVAPDATAEDVRIAEAEA